MDANVAMVFTCLQADENDNLGGPRQKFYNDTFSSLFLLAFAQLLHHARAWVEPWYPGEVTTLSFSLVARKIRREAQSRAKLQ